MIKTKKRGKTMQIHCEFCGFMIETDREDCCPNCGATYDENKEYEQLKLLELEKERIKNEKEKAELKRKAAAEKRKEEKRKIEKRKQSLGVGILVFFIVIMFIIPGLVGMVLGIMESVNPDDYQQSDEYDNYFEDEHYVNATANFNEFADNTTYAVKIDSIKEINKSDHYIPNGHMCIAIHIIIKNTSDTDIQVWTPSVNCIVNGFVQETTYDINYKDITTNFVSPGLLTDGYAIFVIPKDVQTIALKYDEYITINIDPNYIQRIE